MNKNDTKNKPTIRSSTAEYLTFAAATGDNTDSIEMRYEDENIWLTQKMMAELYGVSVPAIRQHLDRLIADGELDSATIKQYLIVQNEGERTVKRSVDHYNLQTIISIGFKVENERAVQFRKWARQIVKEKIENSVSIIDLSYELRLLLGAKKLCELCKCHDDDEKNKNNKFGNVVNYFKDSAYIHVRNLYNFFAANTTNDAKVTQFTNYEFDVRLYKTWINALHTHVLHIKTGRNRPNNVINGRHINTMIPDFTEDIVRLWQEWIDSSNETKIKNELKKALERAEVDAKNDFDSLNNLLKTN
ncbi:MAG: RhuM family protein [Candidatus Roizmanbacteria bacterium]